MLFYTIVGLFIGFLVLSLIIEIVDNRTKSRKVQKVLENIFITYALVFMLGLGVCLFAIIVSLKSAI